MKITLLIPFFSAVCFANTPVFAQDNNQDILTNVDRLSDIKPTDWAAEALQSLVDRYGCIAGYPDNTFRGDRVLTRWEFAAAVNACLNKIESEIAAIENKDDLATISRLQQDFSTELTALDNRVTDLESRIDSLEDDRFAATTKMTGQAIIALSSGSFEGDRVIAPTGEIVTTEDPQTTLIFRASIDLNTSFYGTDLLKIRLLAGSEGFRDNAAGFLEPNFGSTLDFSIPGREQFRIGRLYYSFQPIEDLRVTLGSNIVATEYVDRNTYANNSFRDFSTQALINNFVIFPRASGAGAVLEWHPKDSDFTLRALYLSANPASNNDNPERSFEGPFAPLLIFPNRGGEGGLFGDPYQGMFEFEFAPSKNFALRLQYSTGEVTGSPFEAIGANFEALLTDNLAIFGRYGYSNYENTTLGELSPNYWMFGIAFPDLFVEGAKSGIAIGQPLIEAKIGDATQTNIEFFYNYPISKNITLTPILQVITNAGNQEDSGTIYTGTLRAVFSF
jgi:porin